MLDDLELPNRGSVAHVSLPEPRPVAPSVGQVQQVPLAPDDTADGRQAPPARAGWTGLGVIAQFVADHRRGEIVQIGDDDTAQLPRLADCPVIAQQLDDDRLRHDMVIGRIRTFEGEIADFLRRIAVGHPRAEKAGDVFTKLRRHDLAERAQVAEPVEAPPARDTGIEQHLDHAGIA